ncbi:MAG: porin [Planctomycetota bacterium]
MKHISPSLLVLAVFTAVPSAYSLDVKDEDMKLGLVMRIQMRAERANASDNTGDTHNIANGVTGQPDTADFYLRRFRFGFKGTYQNDYKFAAIVRMDNADRTANSDSGRNAVIHQAYLARVFKPEGSDTEHIVSAGLNYSFFNGAQDTFSSSQQLFPAPRATEGSTFLAPRGVGVAYKAVGKLLSNNYQFGVDILNNTGDDATATTRKEGLCYVARFEYVPYDSVPGHMKTTESFVGAKGTGMLIALDAGINKNDITSATARQTRKAEGIEVLVHHDSLTALFEYRVAQLETDNTVAANTNAGSKAIILQAGWAMPWYDGVIEPSFRWSRIDLDKDTVETSAFGTADFGNSGFQTELGVNWYINKTHNNKLQFAYLDWRGEQSSLATVESPARAHVLRAQWQVNF